MKIIITESKLVNLFKQRYGVDFSGRVQKITDHNQLPNKFKWFHKNFFDSYLNFIPGQITPFYLIEADGKLYLYHKRTLSGNIDEDMIDEEIVDERGQIVSVNGFKKSNNIPNIGLSLSDFFDMYIDKSSDVDEM
jgi:hypothetical protein